MTWEQFQDLDSLQLEGEGGDEDFSTTNPMSGASRKWVAIEDLSEAQMRFFCATTELLASLCEGRNYTSQMIIRAVFPVDHLLAGMKAISDSGSVYLRSNRIDPSPFGMGGEQTQESGKAKAETKSDMLAAFFSLLRRLYIHSAMLDVISNSVTDNTLVWTEGQTEAQDDYEDVKVRIRNKLFTVSTQFKEPKTFAQLKAEDTLNPHKPLLAYIKERDPTFDVPAQNPSPKVKQAIVSKTKAILSDEWQQYIILDLHGFHQRKRLVNRLASGQLDPSNPRGGTLRKSGGGQVLLLGTRQLIHVPVHKRWEMSHGDDDDARPERREEAHRGKG